MADQLRIREIPSRETFPADTEWVEGPKRNKRLVFNILFSAGGVTDTAEAVSQRGDRLLDRSLPMSNGEAIWLQIRQAELTPDENKGIASVRREWPVIEVSSMDTLNLAWGLWITTGNPVGVPLIVEMPLGRRNFKVKTPEENGTR